MPRASRAPIQCLHHKAEAQQVANRFPHHHLVSQVHKFPQPQPAIQIKYLNYQIPHANSEPPKASRLTD